MRYGAFAWSRYCSGARNHGDWRGAAVRHPFPALDRNGFIVETRGGRHNDEVTLENCSFAVFWRLYATPTARPAYVLARCSVRLNRCRCPGANQPGCSLWLRLDGDPGSRQRRTCSLRQDAGDAMHGARFPARRVTGGDVESIRKCTHEGTSCTRFASRTHENAFH